MLRIFRVVFFAFFFVFFTFPAFSQAQNGTLTGTTRGLFLFNGQTHIPLWQNGEVYKIVKGKSWYILTSEGIYASDDLRTFESRNAGLPINIIKEFDGITKKFVPKTHFLKDIKIHPENPDILVTATKDNVYLSKNGGISWQNLGSASQTSSIKAVAVANTPELTVFMSHAIYGFSYFLPETQSPKWIDANEGFERLQTVNYSDEVSDILPVIIVDENGNTKIEIYVSQTFRPCLYRFNWQTKKAELIWKGNEPLDTIDGLFFAQNRLFFTRQKGIYEYNTQTGKIFEDPLYPNWWKVVLQKAPGFIQCAVLAKSDSFLPFQLFLSELWLLKPSFIQSDYAAKANNKKGLYAPVHQILSESGQEKYLNLLQKNKLNALVIDMKDDTGYLRYNSQNQAILQKAKIGQNPLDLNTFIPKMKAQNVYLIARVVVFKDKNLATYNNNAFAVWDKKNAKPWMGIRRITEDKTTEYYEENWVDPFCEYVWEYNIAVANELITRGFDEIQFDYIRFPTDGLNLYDATYRWQDAGMDKESALISFLSYARKNIKAPISIDIYGANGWYRTGARTGQDVELLARYVDIISPMLYPSHFEQTFLAHTPPEERPFRVYFYGTYRNAVIARNQVLVRPWAQAFYLNVSYDRVHYNEDYVQRQIYGVQQSVNHGYLYWNNIGRYDDLRPDLDEADSYLWSAFEANRIFRKPALGGN